MRSTIITMICILSTTICSANGMVGSWKGKLLENFTSLNIVIHLTKDANNNWGATMDSPDQMAYGIKMQTLYAQNDSISLTIPNLKINYQGKYSSDSIKGTFTQQGQLFPLNLNRFVDENINNRPQTPQAPFPYTEQLVTFKNGEIELAGTMTLPKNIGKNKLPAILLIAGSGPIDRDENMFNHKPFAVIADFFTKKGFIVLRYDKRGIGDSKGNFSTATTADFTSDAQAALAYLREVKHVDTQKIGVIGHSEGASIVFQLANQKSINFMVSMAGPGISGGDILKRQVKILTRNAPQFLTDYNKTIDYISATQPDAIDESLVASCFSYLDSTSNGKERVQQLTNALLTPWMVHFIQYNPCNDIKSIKRPLFAIHGAKDIHIEPELNLRSIEQCFTNKKLLTTKIYPNLNHLFQNSTTGMPNEYVQIKETIDINVLNDIYLWITNIIA